MTWILQASRDNYLKNRQPPTENFNALSLQKINCKNVHDRIIHWVLHLCLLLKKPLYLTHILLNDWAMKLEEVLGVWLNFVAWSRIGFWQIEQLLCRQLLLYDKFEGVTRGNRPNWVLMPVISFSMSPFPVWHDNTRVSGKHGSLSSTHQ